MAAFNDSPLVNLPTELWTIEIMSSFGLVELYRISRVSRFFKKLCRDPNLKIPAKFIQAIQLQLDRQDFEKAEEIATICIRDYKDEEYGYKQRALSRTYTQKTALAVEDYQMAYQIAIIKKKYGVAHLIESHIFLTRRKYLEAFDSINKAIAIAPEDPRYYHQRAFVRYKMNTKKINSKEAKHTLELADYQAILKIGSYDRMYVVWNNIGFLHFEKGDFDNALLSYEKSVEQLPYHVRALYNRSLLFKQQGNWHGAMRDYEAMLEINPKIYELHYLKARGYCALRKTSKAIESCEKALTKTTFYANAVYLYMHLSLTEFTLPKFKRALALVDGLLVYHIDKVAQEYKSLPTRKFIYPEILDIEKQQMETKQRVYEASLGLVWKATVQFSCLIGDMTKAKEYYDKLSTLSTVSDMWILNIFMEFIIDKEWNLLVPLEVVSLSKELLVYNQTSLLTLVEVLDKLKDGVLRLDTIAAKVFLWLNFAVSMSRTMLVTDNYNNRLDVFLNLLKEDRAGFNAATRSPWCLLGIYRLHAKLTEDSFKQVLNKVERLHKYLDEKEFITCTKTLVEGILCR